MRCRVLLLSTLAALGATGARAQDWYTGAPRTPQNDTRPSVAIDLTLTGSSQETMHGSLIGTIAPFSKLEESGARVRVSGLVGSYGYISTTAGVGRVRGSQATGSLLVGYEWVTRNATFAGYIGAEIANNTLDKVDVNNKSAGMAAGFKIGADFYANPTDNTMVSGVFSFSTAHQAYYARLKGGFAIVDRVFVGPEVLLLGDNFYSQWRAGVHVTGIKFGALQFGLSGGYVNDRVRGTGYYGILDARITF